MKMEYRYILFKYNLFYPRFIYNGELVTETKWLELKKKYDEALEVAAKKYKSRVLRQLVIQKERREKRTPPRQSPARV